MPKSHVGMGYHLCPVCGTKHDEVVLLNTRFRNTLEAENFMGWAMCPEHEELRQKGYIALIAVTGEAYDLAKANRTGEIIHIRSSAWPKIFNVPVPDKGIAFVEPAVVEALKKFQ